MRSRRTWIAAAGIVLIAAVAWIVGSCDRGDGRQIVASGTIEATEAQLGLQAPGRIDSIFVREGDPVRKGQKLASIDREEANARRRQAEAQLAASRALLKEMEGGFRNEEIAQARAGRNAAQQRMEDARRDLDRTDMLHQGGAVSQEALDKSRLAFDLARSQYEQAEEQLRLLEAGQRKERIEAQRAQVAQAEASLEAVEAALSNMVILSPFDGIVTVRHREPGEIVPPGSAVVTVMNRDDRWVRIYVPENRIGAVQIGQKASIRSDTFPQKSYAGAVVFIASEAEFTPKTVQTTEERVKLVYAVKVRIDGDPDHELKPGMPADVRLEAIGS